MKARVISVSNQKGGVGKTTTAVNLAWALSMRGKRILVIDMDPQANATDTLGIDPGNAKWTTYDVLIDKKKIISTALTHTRNELIDLLPSNVKLSALERELAGSASAAIALRRKIDNLALETYDFIFIDCPPSLGLVTLNSLVASNSVIIPMQADSHYALLGVEDLQQTIEDVQSINSLLKIEGILITMYDARTNICKAMEHEIRQYFVKENIFETIINKNTSINQATQQRQTIFEFERRATGVRDYKRLAKEILNEPITEESEEENEYSTSVGLE